MKLSSFMPYEGDGCARVARPEQEKGNYCMKTFPKTLKAAQDESKSQWAIGDALIVECGAPSSSGVNTGVHDLLEDAAKWLKTKGFDYSVGSLRRIRGVAAAFSKKDRRDDVSFGAHQDAGTPEMLQAIIRGTNKSITGDYVRKVKSAIRNRALDEDDGDAPPEFNEDYLPKPKEVPLLAAEGEILALILGVVKSTTDIDKKLSEIKGQLPQSSIDAMREQLIVAQEGINSLISSLDRGGKATRSHLSVLAGGAA